MSVSGVLQCSADFHVSFYTAKARWRRKAAATNGRNPSVPTRKDEYGHPRGAVSEAKYLWWRTASEGGPYNGGRKIIAQERVRYARATREGLPEMGKVCEDGEKKPHP